MRLGQVERLLDAVPEAHAASPRPSRAPPGPARSGSRRRWGRSRGRGRRTGARAGRARPGWRSIARRPATATDAARWRSRAPATISTAKAMAQSTTAVPMSGSIRIRAPSAAVTSRNGHRPGRPLQAPRVAGDRLGQPQGQRQLGELGGLQLADRAEVDPAPRAVDLHAEGRHQHHQQQEDRDGQRRRPEALHALGAHAGEDARTRARPDDGVGGLAGDQAERVAVVQQRRRARGRVDHDQAERDEREHDARSAGARRPRGRGRSASRRAGTAAGGAVPRSLRFAATRGSLRAVSARRPPGRRPGRPRRARCSPRTGRSSRTPATAAPSRPRRPRGGGRDGRLDRAAALGGDPLRRLERAPDLLARPRRPGRPGHDRARAAPARARRRASPWPARRRPGGRPRG